MYDDEGESIGKKRAKWPRRIATVQDSWRHDQSSRTKAAACAICSLYYDSSSLVYRPLTADLSLLTSTAGKSLWSIGKQIDGGYQLLYLAGMWGRWTQ